LVWKADLIGQGPKLLIAFHGYGQNADVFRHMEELMQDEYTFMLIDLAFHRHQKDFPRGFIFDAEYSKQWISAILEKSGKSVVSLIGFSIVALLIAQPIFLFSIGGWVTRVGIAIYVACLISLLFDRLAQQQENIKPTKLYWWFVFSLGTYFLATGLSQIVNGTFVPNRLDAPSRLLFSILIFYAVFKYRIDFSKILQISIPLSIAFFFIFIELRPDQITLAKSFWGGRYSLPFIDPILLSAWLSCFGLICLTFTNDEVKFSSIVKNIIFMLVFGLTVFMAFITESRTGWLAIPVTLIIFLFKPFKLWAKLLITLISLACVIYMVTTFPIIARQLPSHSDIENGNTDYSGLFDQTNNTMKEYLRNYLLQQQQI
jgi:hypothetical protein